MKKIKEFFSNAFRKNSKRIKLGVRIREFLVDMSEEIDRKIVIVAVLFLSASLMVMGIQVFIFKRPIWADVITVFFSLFFTYCLYLCIKASKKNNEKSRELERQRAREDNLKQIDLLLNKYEQIVDIVEKSITKIAGSYINQNYGVQIFDKANWGYLIELSDLLDDIAYEKPDFETLDSFITASCLIKAIIYNPVVVILDESGKETSKATFNLNLDIAFHAALEIISSPMTFEINDDNECAQKIHPKADMKVPMGLDFSSTLMERIKSSMFEDYVDNRNISTKQLAYFLELLYLYCQK